MNKKIIIIVGAFLLMIPFRLPISVLFIELISDLANLTGNLPHDILSANVVLTKIIYDSALATWSIFNIEYLFRDINKRKALEYKGSKNMKKEHDIYNCTILAILLYVVYIIFDAATTHSLYYALTTN